MAKLVNLIIDRAVLLDIGIARRNIGLRLVVIIVGDKIFHGIVREKLLKLTVKLTGQGLVVGDDQGWLVDFGNDLAHGIGLTRSSRPHENLGLLSTLDIVHQGFNSLGLVTRWFILGDQLKCLVFSSINHVLTLWHSSSSDAVPLPSFSLGIPILTYQLQKNWVRKTQFIDYDTCFSFLSCHAKKRMPASKTRLAKRLPSVPKAPPEIQSAASGLAPNRKKDKPVDFPLTARP